MERSLGIKEHLNSGGNAYQLNPTWCLSFVFASVQNLIISLSPPFGVRSIDSQHMSLELIAAYLRLSRRNNWHQITSYLRASGCCHSDALHACLLLIHGISVCVLTEKEVELSDPHIKSETPVSHCTNRRQGKIDLSSLPEWKWEIITNLFLLLQMTEKVN